MCEEWTSGPYCTLCNVSDGSRFYSESRCMPCKDGLLADLLWKCGLIAVGAVALLTILSRCKCYERTRCLQRWFFKGVVMYGQLDMRAKFKQYATQASNPRLADPRQVCCSHVLTSPWTGLIDGGHSYRLASRDFKTLRSACRIIAFHDIVNTPRVGVDAVPRLWKDLTDPQSEHFAHEFGSEMCTHQPKFSDGHLMGIGVLIRK